MFVAVFLGGPQITVITRESRKLKSDDVRGRSQGQKAKNTELTHPKPVISCQLTHNFACFFSVRFSSLLGRQKIGWETTTKLTAYSTLVLVLLCVFGAIKFYRFFIFMHFSATRARLAAKPGKVRIHRNGPLHTDDTRSRQDPTSQNQFMGSRNELLYFCFLPAPRIGMMVTRPVKTQALSSPPGREREKCENCKIFTGSSLHCTCTFRRVAQSTALANSQVGDYRITE